MHTEKQQSLEDIAKIRQLMERSSRFLSLSGWSGVFAGVYALIGAAVVYFDVKILSSKSEMLTYSNYIREGNQQELLHKKMLFLGVMAVVVLLLSIITGYLFSKSKANKKGLPMWDANTKRVLVNLSIPLVAGGVFCLFLIKHGALGLVAPATLLFYGIALYNVSKYTYSEIRYLALSEIILGLVACYFYGMGLLFWTIGFGVLHIVYGLVMYFRYERN
jgi:hypothetical protein